MKVTKNQLDELYHFTKKHYVEWYDLQMELVDHLANGIEAEWQLNPKLSFEDALQIEFKKFGVFGFMNVVEERQKSLGKKYSKLIWKHTLEFFKLPKLLILIFLSAVVFITLRTVDLMSEFFAVGMAIILVGYFVFLMTNFYRNRKAKQLSKEKKWLFEDIIMQYGSGLGLTMLPLYLYNVIIPNEVNFVEMNTYLLAINSFLIVLICTMIYIMLVEIPNKAQEYLEETYPEYKLVY